MRHLLMTSPFKDVLMAKALTLLDGLNTTPPQDASSDDDSNRRPSGTSV